MDYASGQTEKFLISLGSVHFRFHVISANKFCKLDPKSLVKFRSISGASDSFHVEKERCKKSSICKGLEAEAERVDSYQEMEEVGTTH